MENLPQRKRIRLTEYNYSQNGAYFITICTRNREHLFGSVTDGVMCLNKTGEIADYHIGEIKNHITGVTVTNYIVMPNHIHIMLMVDVPIVGTRYIVSEKRTPCMASLHEKSKQIVPKAVQQFKASVTREAKIADVWQSRYHDHIIRNEQEYQKIWDYINTNPIKWAEDCFYEE